MRAVVTGGAGFIGSHLVDVLLGRGDQVHVVDNLVTGSRENLASSTELRELDIRDEELEQLAGQLRPEVLFHLARSVCSRLLARDARVVFVSSGGAPLSENYGGERGASAPGELARGAGRIDDALCGLVRTWEPYAKGAASGPLPSS